VRLTIVVLAVAIGLAGIDGGIATVSTIAAAPADGMAAWALMLVGLGMVGVAARRHILAEFTGAARRSPTSTQSRA
jgi:hypothetical protein